MTTSGCIQLIWLGGFTTGVCGRFLLLTWWMVTEFHGWWRRQGIIENKCTVICCETLAVVHWYWQFQLCHGVWRWWQGSTIWILDRVPFSLDHLGSGMEDPLQISCHGWSSDWHPAGLNIAWLLGGCMLWVWVHVGREERGVCFLGIYPSGAMLVTGWFLPAGLSCNPGEQVTYQWLSCRDALQSLMLQPLGSRVTNAIRFFHWQVTLHTFQWNTRAGY